MTQSRGPARRRPAAALAAGLLVLAGVGVAAPGAAHAEGASAPDRSVRATEGRTVSVPLLTDDVAAKHGTARLLLDGLPAGSTLTADGRRAVVPQEGAWQITDHGDAVTFTPVAARLGREPTAVRYVATGTDGSTTGPGVVSISTPVIPDMVRAADFGAPVAFPVLGAAQNVDVSSVRLEALPGDSRAAVTDDGGTVTVAGQGKWTLDRAQGAVVFAPDNPSVRSVAPVRITGTDGTGQSASAALLEVGYPHLTERVVAEQPGASAQFDLLDGSQNVRADSLGFAPPDPATGGQLSADGRTLTVPHQGTWTIDAERRTARFEPDGELTSSPVPVSYAATGLYAEATTTAPLTAEYTQTPPTARNERLSGRPGQTLTVDLLANDTPGSVSVPLSAASVRLTAPGASGIPELSDSSGTWLEVPGEGSYSVSPDGVLSFTPDAGFAGTTSPIEYTVSDAAGVKVSASVTADVDPQSAPAAAPRQSGSGGITSMLASLRTAGSPGLTVFATFATLLLFSGAASLWIGSRMEADRRSSL